MLQEPVNEVPQILHRLARSSDSTARRKGESSDNVVGNQIQIVETVFKALGTLTWESFATHRLPLLNLPEPILEALRSVKIEYTKARVIAKVKDPIQQQDLLDKVIRENLSLSQIRGEVSAIGQPSQPESLILKHEFDKVCGRLKKSEMWSDRNKEKRLQKLLSEIKSLLGEQCA